MITSNDATSREQSLNHSMEICRLTQVCLEQSGYSALRRVCCDFQNGILRLTGCLPSYHLKQIALTLVAGVEGVREIQDEIQVLGVNRFQAVGQESSVN